MTKTYTKNTSTDLQVCYILRIPSCFTANIFGTSDLQQNLIFFRYPNRETIPQLAPFLFYSSSESLMTLREKKEGKSDHFFFSFSGKMFDRKWKKKKNAFATVRFQFGDFSAKIWYFFYLFMAKHPTNLLNFTV